MRITFLTPPSFDKNKPAERTAGCTRLVYDMPNIYELTVVALLEECGYQINYKNFVLERGTKEDCIDYIKNDNSDIYFFWSVNLSISTDAMVQEIIHKYQPEAKCIFLGPAGTYFPQMLLDKKHPDSSIIARGEPDLTAKELINLISRGEEWHGIKGISYIDESGKIKHNPTRPLIDNLDEIPFPAIHHIKDYHFFNPKLKVSPYISMVTSRNCPFHCIYCVPSSLSFAREIEHKAVTGKKPPVGFRSTENVIAEINKLAEMGYKAIGFMDDNFLTTTKRLQPIGEALKKYGIVWGCQARVDAISEDMAKMLQEYNCQYVDLGVESFNDDILKYIKKGITEKDIYRAIDLLHKYNVPIKLNILIGTSPLETVETIKDTLKKAKALKVSQVMFNIVSPFPATLFHDIAKENGWIKGGEYTPTDVQRTSILNYPNLSSKQMENLLFWNNIRFYLSPSFIFSNISKFSSAKDFWIAFKALKTKLFG